MTQSTVLKLKKQSIGNDIRIIGSRKSGKTTYLASLLRLPDELKKQFPGLKIIPASDDAEELIGAAKNILEQGAVFAPNDIGNEPYFSFEIQIPASKNSPGITLNLAVKDYAGETFECAAYPSRASEFAEYLEDWLTSPSWMIMLTDWEATNDQKIYAPALYKLLTELSEQAGVNETLNNLRVAVVMSKCERGEIWPCRLDAEEDLFKVRLQETYKVLKEKLPPDRLRFFACSSFGIMSDRLGEHDPRPNRYIPDDGSSAEFSAYLRDKDAWKPFGLISPLYWLSTGRVFHDERL
ncbi:MAG: hypothetical protein ACKPEO_04270 [Sphaerospermopsis kisseleviana]|uniref:TRAFAC clade GTPase domain-containing protein n=1 Tax=Sphaerospermopsis sp. FACHB-1094 TaxID=2692861 RepID=UPI001688954D|nr:hypothetical protein [Sphaerospermopsis sp. FACHB-1094]MBD2132442.1 hypothetical protein [Sphaerospermopsis sp. FACHB-1094]